MNFLTIDISSSTGIHIGVGWSLIVILITALGIYLYLRRDHLCDQSSYLEVNEAEIGIGSNKIKLKANIDDLQVGFKFWTEVNTRKIGLKIDEEHDVIFEVYNSWYEFFKISRELIKSIPISKVRSNMATKELVVILVHILNMELRPHLTKWQAKYRRWWENASTSSENIGKTPQELQRMYPHHDDLMKELKEVNSKLVVYADLLKKMVGI